MNLLITGGNGVLAQNILPKLIKDKFTVFNPSHTDLDILNLAKLKDFVDKNEIHGILHMAIQGGRRLIVDDCSVLYNNIRMAENIIKVSEKCKFVINFCSGTAFDKSRNISNIEEYEIFNRLPIDYYGLSKNIIAKRMIQTGLYNLRIFSVFCNNDKIGKFISKDKTILHIFQDRYMDFISINDLYKIILYYIEHPNTNVPLDINCVYHKKYKLSEIANLMRRPFIIDKPGYGNCYTGNDDKLQRLPINLNTLENELEEFI